MNARGVSDGAIGAVTAALYGGLLLGTSVAPALLRGVGHRMSAVLAAGLAGASAAMLAVTHGPMCALARGLGGLSLAVLYVAFESWIVEVAKERRGRALGTYMVTTYTGLAVAPWLVGDGVSFGVGAAIVAMSALPVLRLRAEPARPARGAVVRGLRRRAPLGAMAALASGATTGALLALTPLYCARMEMTGAVGSAFLSAPLLLGLLLQAPLGRWIDSLGAERITVWVAAALGATALSTVVATGAAAFATGAMAGGLAFGLYPLALALVQSRMSAHERVAGSAFVLRWWGLGAALGPLFGGLLMGSSGPPTLFLLVSAWGLLLFGAARVRRPGDTLGLRRLVQRNRGYSQRPLHRARPHRTRPRAPAAPR